MSYVDASAIVAGAVEEDRTFFDETLLNEWLSTWESEANNDGYRVEIWAVFHEHEPSDEECSCVQYLQTHEPFRTFNPNGAT